MNRSRLIVGTLLLFLPLSMTQAQRSLSEDWKLLFNGKNFNGWEVYLGVPHKSVELENLPRNESGEYTEPLGLNNDPLNVYSVVTEDGQPAIRASGKIFGTITTKEKFKNYHLQLEFKWGQEKWPPRANAKRDGGLLYHAFGEHGGSEGPWMKSQELQIQESDVGDFWAVGGAAMDIPAKPKGPENIYTYTPGASLVTFSEELPQGRHCKKLSDNEKPYGKWNTVDLYVYGSTAVHVVNGKVVMVLKNSRYLEDGKSTPLTSGKIQLQSEGAEIYYRNLKIRSIDRIPEKLLP